MQLQVESQTFSIEGFTFSPTQLIPKEGMDYDQWQRLGDFIRLTNQASQWWWGDWLNIGEQEFGERSAQALESTRWEEETLRAYAWVARKVHPDNRLTGVPFSHYLQLAKLKPAQQRTWAEKIVNGQLSQRQLRAALKTTDESPGVQPCVLVRCDDGPQADLVEAWAIAQGYGTDRLERTRK